MIGRQIKKDKWMLFGGLMLFFAMVVIVVAGTVAFEYIESPQFCGTFCHVMNPYYDSFQYPGNNSIMAVHLETEIKCSNCHDEPGIIGKIEGLLSAIPEAYYYYTNTYDPDNLGGEFSREACLKCHDDTIASAPGVVKTTTDEYIDPHIDEKRCTNCHNLHHKGFGLSETSCAVCHGISYNNFDEMLTDHGIRTELECMECHDRLHPDNAKISFTEYPTIINTEFCSDCHGDDVDRLYIESHEANSCMDCHNEHGVLSINFKNCDNSCHKPPSNHDKTTIHCSVCHDLSTIHIEPGIDLGESFLDIDCAYCHPVENSAYEETFTKKSLEIYGENRCFKCHSEHNVIIYPHPITSPFDDCINCHSNYNKPRTVHDRTGISYKDFPGLINDFCSDCHYDETLKFNRELHNSLQCVECHGEHNIIKVEFKNCESCHDIPSDHDSSVKSCSGSTCHLDTRSIHSET